MPAILVLNSWDQLFSVRHPHEKWFESLLFQPLSGLALFMVHLRQMGMLCSSFIKGSVVSSNVLFILQPTRRSQVLYNDAIGTLKTLLELKK
jgi:hypothetical protein